MCCRTDSSGITSLEKAEAVIEITEMVEFEVPIKNATMTESAKKEQAKNKGSEKGDKAEAAAEPEDAGEEGSEKGGEKGDEADKGSEDEAAAAEEEGDEEVRLKTCV